MDSYSDIELVERSQNGDEAAFEHLVNRHYKTVYRVSYKWCGVKEDAEDITQEVFVKLTGKLRMFSNRSSFSTWLYRVTINTAKDFGRKTRLEDHMSLNSQTTRPGKAATRPWKRFKPWKFTTPWTGFRPNRRPLSCW